MARVDLTLQAKVVGAAELKDFALALETIKKQENQIAYATRFASFQISKRTALQKTQNELLQGYATVSDREVYGLTAEKMKTEELIAQQEKRVRVMRRAYELQKEAGVSTETLVDTYKAKATADIEDQIRTENRAAAYRVLTAEMRAQRMELMQASISMFVLGITATQTFGVLERMAGTNTELGQTFHGIGEGVKFMLGPIQVATALMQFLNMENKALMVTMAKYIGVLGVLYFLYKAITAQSKLMRIAFAAMAGAVTALTIAMWALKGAELAATLASIARWVGVSGPVMGPVIGAILVAAIGGAIAAGAAALASIPSGQTVPGYARPVRDTGLFYAHKGEMVGRVGAMGPMGGTTINVYNTFESGTIVDDGILPKISRAVEQSVAAGLGT